MKSSSLSVIEKPVGDIIKSNKLVEAKYDLSLLEQKFVLLAISKIDPKKIDKNEVSILVREFCNLIGSSQERYTEVKEVIKNLRKKEIIITQYDNNNEIQEELIAGWINSSHYKKGVIEIELPKKLMPYLVELKERYTLYNIQNIANLSSKYGIRIYEIMKENEFKKNITLNYDWVKDLICGNDKFERYYDFKKYVLNPALSEIKEKTDIYLEFTEIRRGKKVESLQFKIHPNSKIIEKRNKQKEFNESIKYYGTNDIENIVDRYSKKTKSELIDELTGLMQSRYGTSISYKDLNEYSENVIKNVIFGIVDGVYKDVQKPIPYFKEVLKNEQEKLK